MIAVSDTSPINYLVLIELQHLLPELFGHVFIPDAVHLELRSPGAPEAIGRFLAVLPSWLEIRSAPSNATLRSLDAGEREAISLALAVGADLVLMDERKGRQAARELGLRVSGTIGVIRLAADRKLVSLQDVLDRLASTNFRVSPRLPSSLQGGTDRG